MKLNSVITISAALLVGAAVFFAARALFPPKDQTGEVIALGATVDSLLKRTTHLENAYGISVAQNEAQQTANAEALGEFTARVFKLEKQAEKRVGSVQSYTRVDQEFRDTGKFAAFTPDTSKRDNVSEYKKDSGYIKVPQPFVYQDSTIEFGGKVLQKGVHIDSIIVANTLHLRTFELKRPFFGGTKEYQVQAINSNPAIRTSGLAHVQVKPRIGWWNRWGKPVLVGAAAATITAVVVQRGKTKYVQPTGGMGQRPPRVYPPQ